jgi:hypothetical protein
MGCASISRVAVGKVEARLEILGYRTKVSLRRAICAILINFGYGKL